MAKVNWSERRSARHALALTGAGRLNLRNAAFARDLRPLDPASSCPVCASFTRAYLSHLFRAGEMLAPRLVSVHNIALLAGITAAARNAINEGRFAAWSQERLAALRDGAAASLK